MSGNVIWRDGGPNLGDGDDICLGVALFGVLPSNLGFARASSICDSYSVSILEDLLVYCKEFPRLDYGTRIASSDHCQSFALPVVLER